MVGDFTLGIYGDILQVDANVKSKFRRLGIATYVYDLAKQIADSLKITVQHSNASSDLGVKFWASR